ncbi:MAG TPA: TCR/Tet family MFS transporter [Bacteroidia bacterium]|jgi:DHA1 family tetracycline resistance protein-like MFS transporter|nr:TCR/Tet family MFS transporter [Bacteroidia bacterium]
MGDKKRTAALGFIFVTLFLDVMGLGIIIPVFPKLIARLIHGDLSAASLWGSCLVAAFAAMQFLFSPIMGGLSDRYGRRPVLLLSLLGFGLDYFVMAFAPTIWWLFGTRVVAGIMGASFTTGTAYIADISTPEKRAQNFGIIGMAFGMGFMFGPAIGGVLAKVDSHLPFIVAGCLSLLNALYGYFILPESLAVENRRKFDWKRANPIGSLKQLAKYPVVLGMVASILCIYMAAHAVQSTWTYFTMLRFNWDEATVGYSLALVGLLVGGVQGGLIRVVIPKIGQKNSVYLGLFLYTVGLVLFSLANQSWMMFVFLIPYALGGVAGPALQGIMSGQVPANAQGELQGALTGLVSLTSFFGPLLMGGLFNYFTTAGNPIYFPGAPFIMGAILCFASLLFAMRTLKKHL